jgi:hypothetical protein
MRTHLVHAETGRSFLVLAAALCISGVALTSSQAQQIKWGLTLTNINNPITPAVATNSDGSISITAGGGDTYSAPDSFTYAYQQATGDFDIRVQIANVTATDPLGQDSPKGSLMVRASLDPNSDHSWTDIGTANPSAPIAIGATPMFFRVRSP